MPSPSTPRHFTSSLSGCLLLLTLGACGPFTGDPVGQPEGSDYDQSCSVDADCTIVWLARACSCSSRAAVNVSEVSDVDRDNEREHRFEDRCRSQVDCGAPEPAEPACNAGTCEVRITGTLIEE